MSVDHDNYVFQGHINTLIIVVYPFYFIIINLRLTGLNLRSIRWKINIFEPVCDLERFRIKEVDTLPLLLLRTKFSPTRRHMGCLMSVHERDVFI